MRICGLNQDSGTIEPFDIKISKAVVESDDFYLLLKKLFSYCDRGIRKKLSFFYSCTAHFSGILETEKGKNNYEIIMQILSLNPDTEYLLFIESYLGNESISDDEKELKYEDYDSKYFDIQIHLMGSIRLGGGLSAEVVHPVAYLLSLIDLYNPRIFPDISLVDTMKNLDKRDKINNYKLRKDFKRLFDLTIYEEMLVVKSVETLKSWMKEK